MFLAYTLSDKGTTTFQVHKDLRSLPYVPNGVAFGLEWQDGVVSQRRVHCLTTGRELTTEEAREQAMQIEQTGVRCATILRIRLMEQGKI